MSVRRTVAGLLALAACTTLLWLRIHAIRYSREVELSATAKQLAYLAHLGREVSAYAERYGKPVYEFDLGPYHLTGAESTEVHRLRRELYGGDVVFRWD